ncbi:hypothetical protein BVX97_04865 [bacterium E08(2017)]|nr:hypothetical protein BVX97_04865 [bacterium E08(2017)]
MYVTFWGTRGSIPTPGNNTEKYGGNTPCIHVQHGDTDIILDAGTGIRNLGIDLMANDRTKLDLHLLLSHTHWDHIQGLPFFTPAYSKDTTLHIYGSAQKESFLAGILQRQMDVDYFPIDMNALQAKISIKEIEEQSFEIGSFKVTCQEQVCHPGGSLRYCLEAAGKRVIYATDVELDQIFSSNDKDKKKAQLKEEYTSFISGADLVIADAQYTKEEYKERINWGHTSIPVILDVAHGQNVKQLALFHHDPQRSDVQLDKLWKQHSPEYCLHDDPMNSFWAREGMTLAI